MKAPPWLNDTVVGLSSTVDALKIYCLKSKAIIVCWEKLLLSLLAVDKDHHMLVAGTPDAKKLYSVFGCYHCTKYSTVQMYSSLHYFQRHNENQTCL